MNIANPHPNIQIRTSISVNFSASQWGLHVDKFPRVIVEKVADYLNKRITVCFNKGEPRSKVELAFELRQKILPCTEPPLQLHVKFLLALWILYALKVRNE